MPPAAVATVEDVRSPGTTASPLLGVRMVEAPDASLKEATTAAVAPTRTRTAGPAAMRAVPETANEVAKALAGRP